MFVEHKEAVEVTEAPAKVLKLSEAMRIGAMRHPQNMNALYEAGKTCALGAVAVGRGWMPTDSIPDEVITRYLGDVYNTPLWYEIGAKRNDIGWTREHIADWLEAQGK